MPKYVSTEFRRRTKAVAVDSVLAIIMILRVGSSLRIPSLSTVVNPRFPRAHSRGVTHFKGIVVPRQVYCTHIVIHFCKNFVMSALSSGLDALETARNRVN